MWWLFNCYTVLHHIPRKRFNDNFVHLIQDQFKTGSMFTWYVENIYLSLKASFNTLDSNQGSFLIMLSCLNQTVSGPSEVTHVCYCCHWLLGVGTKSCPINPVAPATANIAWTSVIHWRGSDPSGADSLAECWDTIPGLLVPESNALTTTEPVKEHIGL